MSAGIQATRAPIRRANLRETMPTVAGWMDALRAVFGVDEINDCIRRGLAADCPADRRFYAEEAGQVVGVRPVPSADNGVAPAVRVRTCNPLALCCDADVEAVMARLSAGRPVTLTAQGRLVERAG